MLCRRTCTCNLADNMTSLFCGLPACVNNWALLAFLLLLFFSSFFLKLNVKLTCLCLYQCASFVTLVTPYFTPFFLSLSHVDGTVFRGNMANAYEVRNGTFMVLPERLGTWYTILNRSGPWYWHLLLCQTFLCDRRDFKASQNNTVQSSQQNAVQKMFRVGHSLVLCLRFSAEL